MEPTHDARRTTLRHRGLGVAAVCQRDSQDWRTDGAGARAPWYPDRRIADRAVTFVRDFGLEYRAFDFVLGSEGHGSRVPGM